MEESLLVTGIITTYKREPRFVQRAARSILNQTYQNIELIIVDDSPSDFEQRDEVKRIAESLGENVRYIQHKMNQGACAARNTGISMAKGAIIGFLDDDDEWHEDKVSSMLPLFENNPEIALVYCGSVAIDENKKSTTNIIKIFERGYIYDRLLFENFIGSTSFPLIRKKCLESVGGFDTAMLSSQDYDVWLRLCKKYKVNSTPKQLVYYYIHPGDQISKNFKRLVNGHEKIINKNLDALKKNNKAYAERLACLAPEYAGDGKIVKSIFTAFYTLFKNPFRGYENIRMLYSMFVNYKMYRKRKL